MNKDTEAVSPPPSGQWGRTFIYDGLAQTDLDMAHHRLINLDTTNLPPIGIPPTIHPPPNQWLHDWDGINHIWTATQPSFDDLANFLTRTQMEHITVVGDIRVGSWNATPLAPNRVPRLDLILSPQAPLNMNFKRISNLADPIDPKDAVNMGFVFGMLPGLKPKEAVRVASTAAIMGAAHLIIMDGVQLRENDRVLLKDQLNLGYENGIWIAHDGPWERPADFDALPNDSELVLAAVHVLEGTLNGGSTWVQMTPSPVHIHLSPDGFYPHFVIFESSPNAIVAGAGLSKDGDILNVVGTPGRILVGADNVDIDPAYAGQTSITTLGIVTAGTWRGDTIDGAHGGTGVSNSGKTISLCGNFSTFMPLDAPDITAGRALTFALTDNTRLTLPVSGIVATIDSPETFTNKRITKRVASFTSFAKPAINTDTTDVYKLTIQDQPILSFSDNMTGTPFDGQGLEIFIEEVHEIPPPPAPPEIPVVQSFPINWGDAFRDSQDLKLPQFTVGLAGMYLEFVFNTGHGKWILVNLVEDIAL